MSSQQLNGLGNLLVGVAALILSAGLAWAQSRASRTRRFESGWLVIGAGFVLLVAGIVFCWLGISGLVGV
jgi:hypothetical protein